MTMQTGISLPERTTRVGSALFGSVLSSANLLVAASSLSKDQVKRGIRELEKHALGETHELGCLLPAAPLFFWTEKGLDHFQATGAERSWYGPDGQGNLLLYDFAKVEAVKAIAPFYATQGWSLRHIHFYERQPMTAAAEYVHPDLLVPAYVVFCWASRMETQREFFERLEALEEAMTAEAMKGQDLAPGDTFRPGGVALLAASQWGAAQALCLARAALSGWVQPASIAGWYPAIAGWRVSDAVSALSGAAPEGMPPLSELTCTLPPSVSARKLGSRKLSGVLARSLYAGRGGHKLVALLTLVGILPCGSIAHYQRLMGEKPGGHETRRRIRVLEERGLVEAVAKGGRAWKRKNWPADIPVTLSGRGQGEPRYALTLAGRVAFCYVHGGRPQDLFRRTKLGRLKTLVREQVLLQLWTLSWTVHLRHAPWIRPADGSEFQEMPARQWQDIREGALVYLLTLACMLHLNQARRRKPVEALTLNAMARIWAQVREDMVEDRWLYQHEDLVLEVLGQVSEAGCAYDAGWQARTTLADGKRIDPDAVVRVGTPWGRWWCYLEIELSDRTYMAVKPRCDKYGSANRRDGLPVLIVCRDGPAERNFHLAAASERPPRMLTTTLSRLKEDGMFGPGVWSRYGRPATLSP